MKFDFTVIIPTLNEEVTIGSTIRNVQEIVKKENLHAQILIVDDYSSDNTLFLVNELRLNQRNTLIIGLLATVLFVQRNRKQYFFQTFISVR